MKEFLSMLWNDIIPRLSIPEAALAAFIAAIAQLYGGWSQGMTFLLIAMAVDYISGLIVAAVFHNSNKTETGRLESRAGWKGLIRKGMTQAVVLIAAQVDMTFNTNFIRDAVVIGFTANEVISIIENAGLMGVPITPALENMIDLLKRESDTKAQAILAEGKENPEEGE